MTTATINETARAIDVSSLRIPIAVSVPKSIAAATTLLDNPPLIHASKPGSLYANNRKSYQSLSDLVTRARIAGLIPMNAISDDTRPVVTWNVFADPSVFMRNELNGLMKGYWRDLVQSQPNQIEIVGEKNTVHPILKPVAAEYCIPLTSGRGFSSLPPPVSDGPAIREERQGKADHPFRH